MCLKKEEKEKLYSAFEKGRKRGIRYIKREYKGKTLTATELGVIFEAYAAPVEGVSEEISIEELKKIHPNFKTRHGCDWARSDGGYLGKKYVIERKNEGRGKEVKSVKLCGYNDKEKKNRNVGGNIKRAVSKENCCVLDIGTNIEVDHKNGRYDTKAENIEDFQALCKTANDAKRMHCKRCIETGKRYDAKNLGYCCSYVYGDETSDFCRGCYWYDPKEFNRAVSANFSL